MLDENNISLSQKQILLGSLLGDASMPFKKKYNTKYIQFYHSERQVDYITWLYNNFDDKDKTELKSSVRICNLNEKKYIGYYFCFKIQHYLDLFSFIRKNLYKNNIKKISLKYLNELNEIGLAIWWMDDGCFCFNKKDSTRYGKLSTHNFNYEEHLLIQKYFKEKWNINVSIKKEKGKYYFIRFKCTELQKFIFLIYKTVCEVPSMIYKINFQYTRQAEINKMNDNFNGMYDYIQSKITTNFT